MSQDTHVVTLSVTVRRFNGMWRWSVVDVKARPPRSIGEGQRNRQEVAWADVAALMESQGHGA